MEQVLKKRSSDQEVAWESRMGGEEMADSGVLMEEDVEVELDSGFCVEVDPELSSEGQVSVASDREELDWFVITDDKESVTSDEQREGRVNPTEDGGGFTQEEGEIEVNSGFEVNGETEAETEVTVDSRREEEEMEGAMEVCLWPVEESGGLVRISLEEVERYYRFSRCCHWLCGRCHTFYDLIYLQCLFLCQVIPVLY